MPTEPRRSKVHRQEGLTDATTQLRRRQQTPFGERLTQYLNPSPTSRRPTGHNAPTPLWPRVKRTIVDHDNLAKPPAKKCCVCPAPGPTWVGRSSADVHCLSPVALAWRNLSKRGSRSVASSKSGPYATST